MKLADFPNVEGLSATEKLQLVDEIWASIANELNQAEVTNEEKRLLDERWARYEQNPASALTFEELKAKIRDARG